MNFFFENLTNKFCFSKLGFNLNPFRRYGYATYKRRKAIIRANNPVASEKANPKIAYEKSCPFNIGFLDTPNIKQPNTTPIPIPAPIKPVVANPVPIILAAEDIFIIS